MLSPAEWNALLLSLKVATAATFLGIIPAFGLAYTLARKNFPLKGLVDSLIHLPLVLPPVVTGYFLLLIFAPTAPIGQAFDAIGINLAFSWQGAALASFIVAMPLMVRTIRQAIESIPPEMTEAASSLGATPQQQLIRVIIPLSLPGCISALIVGFARAIGEFGATITFAANIPGLTQTLPLALYSAVQSPNNEAESLRLMILCLIPAIGSLLISNLLTNRFRRKQGLAA